MRKAKNVLKVQILTHSQFQHCGSSEWGALFYSADHHGVMASWLKNVATSGLWPLNNTVAIASWMDISVMSLSGCLLFSRRVSSSLTV